MKEYVFTTAGPFDEDKFLEGELSAFLQNYDKEYDDDAAISDVAIHFYELGKKMKQKPAEWSQEDKNALVLFHELISFGYTERFCDAQTAEDMRRWLNERLKSTRPQPHWKPSEEQPGLPGIEDPGIPGRDFIPVEWVDACEKYGKWKIVKQEQPEVDYNKFEKLFDDFCEENKGHHITSHDACMWFWELGLNARKK